MWRASPNTIGEAESQKAFRTAWRSRGYQGPTDWTPTKEQMLAAARDHYRTNRGNRGRADFYYLCYGEDYVKTPYWWHPTGGLNIPEGWNSPADDVHEGRNRSPSSTRSQTPRTSRDHSMDVSDSDEIPELDPALASELDGVPSVSGSGCRQKVIPPARVPNRAATPPDMDVAMREIERDYAKVAGSTYVAPPKPVATSSPTGQYRMILKPTTGGAGNMPPPPRPVDLTNPNISAEDRLTGLTQHNLHVVQQLAEEKEKNKNLTEQIRKGLFANLLNDDPERKWSEMAERNNQASVTLAKYAADKAVCDLMRDQRDAAFEQVKEMDKARTAEKDLRVDAEKLVARMQGETLEANSRALTSENHVARAKKDNADLNERLDELRKELVVLQTAPQPPKESADEVHHLKDDLWLAQNQIVCLKDTHGKQQDKIKRLEARLNRASSPPRCPDPFASIGQHVCETDKRVYEAIALDGKLDMAWRMLQNIKHAEEDPDEKIYPETRSAFVSELVDIIQTARKHVDQTSTKWYKNHEGERSEYLSQHELGAVESESAPPWQYMKSLRVMVEGVMRLTRMYLDMMSMTKWYGEYNKAGDHGRAELVSLPGDVPPVKANKVRKVCLENHAKPKPVAAESLDAVKHSVDEMRRSMDGQLRNVTERMNALSTQSSAAVASPIAHDVGVIKTTVQRMADENTKHWMKPDKGKTHTYHRVVHHPFTGLPLQSDRNVNAFNKIEEGRSVFLPIARDSLIAGERFMNEVMQGLESSLDFDVEKDWPQSRLSAYNTDVIAAAVRGVAPPPSSRVTTAQDSPCGLRPPPRNLGSLVGNTPHVDEPMDESISFIKQEDVTVKTEPGVASGPSNVLVPIDARGIGPINLCSDDEEAPAETPAKDATAKDPSDGVQE